VRRGLVVLLRPLGSLPCEPRHLVEKAPLVRRLHSTPSDRGRSPAPPAAAFASWPRRKRRRTKLSPARAYCLASS